MSLTRKKDAYKVIRRNITEEKRNRKNDMNDEGRKRILNVVRKCW